MKLFNNSFNSNTTHSEIIETGIYKSRNNDKED